MKKFFAMLVLVAVAALSLSAADVYIKTKTHTDAMSIMGQNTPAQDTVSEAWIGDNVFVTITAEQTIIIDLNKNLAYFITPKTKTYVETPLPLDFAKILPPEAAAMAGMMKMTATVTPTTETKKIGSWNCTGYDVNLNMMMGVAMKMRSWVSMDVPFDATAFSTKFLASMLKGQMRLDDASAKEFAKMKGYQIASDMTGDIMGAKMHNTSEVVEMTKKAAPAGTYAVPAGFTKTATLSMEAATKR
jgi:hypothetical protein